MWITFPLQCRRRETTRLTYRMMTTSSCPTRRATPSDFISRQGVQTVFILLFEIFVCLLQYIFCDIHHHMLKCNRYQYLQGRCNLLERCEDDHDTVEAD